MNRREFLGAGAASALAWAAPEIPVIDTHIHLFDPGRPQGIPWPPKDNALLYKPALPERYRKMTASLGVRGAIVVEASPWLDDNQWVLDVAAKDPVIVGLVGNLEPGKPEFPGHLDRLRKNPLFLGIRYGNLWNRDLAKELGRREFVDDLKRLAQAELSLDTANQTPELLAAALRTSDLVPNLRIVIDHLPQMKNLQEGASSLKELGKRPQIYVKLSEVFRRVDGKVPTDVGFYRGTLDEIFGIFGEDRVLYGSDWPNSDNWRSFAEGLKLMQEYFAGKNAAATEKYFWRNSVKAYRWKPRSADQKLAK